MRILVVEDEPKVAGALETGLGAEGYDVAVALTGDAGDALLHRDAFDLVVLDLMLPGRDGLSILAAARGRGMETPVLVLTARDAVEDRVKGLDAGADDYLVKPFAFAELLARIRALARRGQTGPQLRLAVADLELDRVTRQVHRAGTRLDLTRREFELLEYLLCHRGEIVTRNMLTNDVWDEADRLTSLDNVIDVHIGRLRKKVDRGFGPPLIHTVRGEGFVLKEEGA